MAASSSPSSPAAAGPMAASSRRSVVVVDEGNIIPNKSGDAKAQVCVCRRFCCANSAPPHRSLVCTISDSHMHACTVCD
jgi:hypothetical protein